MTTDFEELEKVADDEILLLFSGRDLDAHPLAFFFLLWVLFGELRGGGDGLFRPLSLSLAQIAVFLLLVVGFMRLRIFSERVPALLVIVCGLSAAAAAAVGYHWQAMGERTVYMAQLKGDEYETDTRVLREDLNGGLKAAGVVRLTRLPVRIERSREVQAVFKADPRALAVVWGWCVEQNPANWGDRGW